MRIKWNICKAVLVIGLCNKLSPKFSRLKQHIYYLIVSVGQECRHGLAGCLWLMVSHGVWSGCWVELWWFPSSSRPGEPASELTHSCWRRLALTALASPQSAQVSSRQHLWWCGEERRGREKHGVVVPPTHARILYAPWPEIEPATLAYQYDALTNWATWPVLKYDEVLHLTWKITY